MKRIMTALLVLMLMLSLCAAAETELKVRGRGVVSVTADCARVVLGVREAAPDALAAQNAANEKINAVIAALKEAGIPDRDLGTESLYIYANYDYSQSPEVLAGYTATNTISIVATDMDKVGEYIDIAFAKGANTLENVQFSLLDSSLAQKEALELAVQNANEKAQIIAGAAGMEVISIDTIDETLEFYGMESGAKFSNARVESAAMGSATMLQASTLEISADVTMEFTLE